MINIIIVLVVVLVLWTLWGFFASRVEQAEYSVVESRNGYEVREYPAHIVAQTTVTGSYGASMNSGFSIVAGYIFGKNTKKESIAMTAPVVAENVSKSSGKVSESIAMTAPVMVTKGSEAQTISFGMPRSHTLESLPTPTDPRVKIVTIPTKKYAVITFSGYRSDARVKNKQDQLLALLARDGVVAEGTTSYAGYNAPGTPPWMMRNEVLVEVK